MTPDSERERVKGNQECRTHRLHCKHVNQKKKKSFCTKEAAAKGTKMGGM